jgi:hypothetical protein
MFFAILMGLGTFAWAGTDYGAGVSARTYPLGAIFTGTIGQSFRLWNQDPFPGEDQRPAGGAAPWRYGFVRGSLTAQTIALVSRVSGEFEFYPISIWGVAAGAGAHWRSGLADPFFDCSVLQCGGVLLKSWVRSQVVAAAGPVFVGAGARLEWLWPDRSKTGFIEESSNLAGAGAADQLFSPWVVGGVNLGNDWKALGWVSYGLFLQNQTRFFSSALAVSKRWGMFTVTGGGGTFESGHQGLGPAFFLQLQWNGKESPVLL